MTFSFGRVCPALGQEWSADGRLNEPSPLPQEIYRAWPSADRPKFAHHLHIKGWNKVRASAVVGVGLIGGQGNLD